MATQFKRITVPELKKGMIVRQHGGRFEVLEDARYSAAHVPYTGVGPSGCAVAASVCIEGEEPGFFSPGSSWGMQGNCLALVLIEA